MKKMMKRYPDFIKRCSLTAIAAASIAWTGCSDDMETYRKNDGFVPSDCLAFTTRLVSGNSSPATRSSSAHIETVEEQWPLQAGRQESIATRGGIINHLSGSAGVLGFQYNDEENKTAIAGGDNNLEFRFESDKLVSANTTILWSTINQAHLNVYAYVPYVPSAPVEGTERPEGMTLDFATAPPWIDYRVPQEIVKQTDLLVASWKSVEHESAEHPEEYKNRTIPLTFNHILTAVRFRVGFACTVKSVVLRNVYNSGRYNFLSGEWENVGTEEEAATGSYRIDFGEEGRHFAENSLLNGSDDHTYLILMPQTLPEEATIVLTYRDDHGEEKSYAAPIGTKVWEPGKLITYTFHTEQAPETIYFDLAAGDVTIQADDKGKGTYSGYIFREGERVEVTGDYTKYENSKEKPYHFYVYQSTEDNRGDIWNGDVCTPPAYPEVEGPDGGSWRDFITDNTDVDRVIESWDVNHENLVKKAGRTATVHKIDINGNVTCDVTIDNIYSIYQQPSTSRDYGGIAFRPTGTNAKVTINSVGDNRVGSVHYFNISDNGNEIIFEGTGSLTVADVDGKMHAGSNNLTDVVGLNAGESGYWSNHWNSAIGGNDGGGENSYGIVINSGILFAGTTKAENCTAIGAGGNGFGKVIINGGTVTAVATTTGTAIGGGIGFNVTGGQGNVTINGGNVYAYNFANRWSIPSSAIGGAGSKKANGNVGTVTITGGYVYALSEGGTAIGGGSSFSTQGGNADITITGGEVFAMTGSKASASIGGGTACSGETNAHNGGSANITISGNPVIRTGSIGGGGKGIGSGYIGNATIDISGGDIQGQFILAAGTSAGQIPSFTMTGGTIRNSDTGDQEYLHVKREGGAVYLENGTVKISGGTIENCKAERGGAVYIEGSSASEGAFNASFTMSGGEIRGNGAQRATGSNADNFVGSGGAVYIQDGAVALSGGTIAGNLAAGGNGGGIFIQRGTLKVEGSATIRNNATEIRATDREGSYAGGNGGGVYIYSQKADVTVDLLSGAITHNTADRRGGGVCVIQDNSEGDNRKALISVGIKGAGDDHLLISGNHTLLEGGGLYAKGVNAEITINSGTIQRNTVSQYVYNQNVANDEGSVTLNGGDVTYNTVTFHANGGHFGNGEETSIQRIVTKTNSKLKTPSPIHAGYTLKGWNTRRSGTGTEYKEGDIMNIQKEMTLYAQWKRD